MIDFTLADPLASADPDQPEALFAAIDALPAWNARTLAIADALLAEWVSDALGRADDRESWAELLRLIKRIQVIRPGDGAPESLRPEVERHYQRWNGMADLLAARIRRQDEHQPEDVEKRAHMPALKTCLQRAGHPVTAGAIQAALGLSPSRVSQLLKLAEAARLITREKQGRERLILACGPWAIAAQAQVPAKGLLLGSDSLHADPGLARAAQDVETEYGLAA